MNRFKLIGWAGLGVALLWTGVWIAGWWGTVTLEVESKPLGRVLESFKRQTGLAILTDLDLQKPVTIRVRRVPVAEALEAIQAASESRGGRLVVWMAPDAAGLARIRGLLPRPPDDSGLLNLEYRIPFPALASLDGIPAWGDPRQQPWRPPATLPRKLRAAAEDAAQASEVRILLPEGWDPALPKSPSGGKISSSLPALAALAGGKSDLAYLLPAPREDGPREGPGSGSGAGSGLRDEFRGRGSSLSPEKWMERLEPRLAVLPAEDAAAARASVQEAVRQFQEWESLPPEQRREKIQALMQDPANAERMSNRFMRGMRNMSPEQRAQRYQNYNTRREAIKDPGHTR